jgi:hypothetical protein
MTLKLSPFLFLADQLEAFADTEQYELLKNMKSDGLTVEGKKLSISFGARDTNPQKILKIVSFSSCT